MQIRYRFNHWLPKLLDVSAITLYPYVLCMFDDDDSEWTKQVLRHELEHCAQVQLYGWLRFYLSYLLYYFAGRVKGEDHEDAYLNIPYEVLARRAEEIV